MGLGGIDTGREIIWDGIGEQTVVQISKWLLCPTLETVSGALPCVSRGYDMVEIGMVLRYLKSLK